MRYKNSDGVGDNTSCIGGVVVLIAARLKLGCRNQFLHPLVTLYSSTSRQTALDLQKPLTLVALRYTSQKKSLCTLHTPKTDPAVCILRTRVQ